MRLFQASKSAYDTRINAVNPGALFGPEALMAARARPESRLASFLSALEPF